MKILIAYPEELPGPQARAVQVISSACGLAEAGAAVTLAHGRTSQSVDIEAVTGSRTPDGLRLLPLPLARDVRMGPLRFSWNWIFNWSLDRAVQSVEPDWIFCRHLKTALRALRRKSAARPAKILYEAHTIFSAEAAASLDSDVILSIPRARRLYEMEEEIFSTADAVLATSQTLASAIRRLYSRESIPVFPHGVWPHHQVPWNPDPSRKTVLYVGQFYLWKGVDTLIHALRFLPEDISLDLIGGRAVDDPDRRRIETLAESLDLRGRVRFHGQLEPRQVADHLASASITVLTTGTTIQATQFTCPIKLFEYLSGGRPVVAARMPVIEEIAGDAAAYYRIGDPADLARALERLLKSPDELRILASKARASAAVRSWTARGREIIEILNPKSY